MQSDHATFRVIVNKEIAFTGEATEPHITQQHNPLAPYTHTHTHTHTHHGNNPVCCLLCHQCCVPTLLPARTWSSSWPSRSLLLLSLRVRNWNVSRDRKCTNLLSLLSSLSSSSAHSGDDATLVVGGVRGGVRGGVVGGATRTRRM